MGSLRYTCSQNLAYWLEKQLCPCENTLIFYRVLMCRKQAVSFWEVLRSWKLTIQFSTAFKHMLKQISSVHHLIPFIY